MNYRVNNRSLQIVLFIALSVLCVTPFVSSPIALALGFLVALFVGNPFQKQTGKSIHLLLQFSIVGLGFGLKLNEALQAGKTGFLLTVVSLTAVLVLGYLIGRRLKIDTKQSYLISAGTAICGGSAIAAVSPIVKADPKQISIALAIVFALNSLALFIYPSVGHLLQMTQEQFGLWCAVGIHDTSSVVGAAAKYGHEALQVATTVKLARALWIIPVSILTMFFFKNKTSKIKIPWFIGLFMVAIVLNSYISFFADFGQIVSPIAKAGLKLTLFFIGTTLSLETLKSIGIKPLILALSLWIAVSVGSLLFIMS